MGSNDSPWGYLSREDVERLIRFYDPESNPEGYRVQTEGCYRLWNTLCDEQLGFAYLADGVGMGKTYQALGLVGLLHYRKPDARIVILCPGKEMQRQWSSDWHSFIQDKYCLNGVDHRLKSPRINSNGVSGCESSVQPLICESLSQFAASLVTSSHTAYLLRYPSFSMPLRVFEWGRFAVDRGAKDSYENLLSEFNKVMEGIGYPLSKKELADYSFSKRFDLDGATKHFLTIFKVIMAKLVEAFSPDLVIWDEAQYLRTDASRNDCICSMFGKLHENGCRHLFVSATPAHRDVSDIEQLNRLLRAKLIQINDNQGQPDEFRKSVSAWMVRRERSFAGLGKLQYRDFREDPVDLFAEEQSPLYALTFAPMQKNLVKLLDGGNNKFRMGEISCHESAKASIDGHLENSSSEKSKEPIDENFLRGLGKRFKELQDFRYQDFGDPLDLPHAKVDHVVDDLTARCLDKGSWVKELVFVRRIATVDELADKLLREFQRILNERILALGVEPDVYWGLAPEPEDDSPDEDEGSDGHESTELMGAAEKLPYFMALSAAKDRLGRLTKYRNSLGREKTSTIRFLLVSKAEMKGEDEKLWQRFMLALGVSKEKYKPFEKDQGKEFLLRRCIAHSLRFTDILVDLDVLRKRNKMGYIREWLEMLADPPDALKDYFCNTRMKLCSWVDRFDTIVNKCFKGNGQKNDFKEIAGQVANYFRGLSPVARRSGRHADENVVIQFKFPVYPNVLVCTDVLREGVNLHLFCERVSNYGIAWNSGDLEQRIGRVERSDSLFEKQILHNEHHKLHVGFPYLAKTLDERQVKKAIKRKRNIDKLFSLIPPKEMGECDDIMEKDTTGSDDRRVMDPILPEMPEWESVGEGWTERNTEALETSNKILNHAYDLLKEIGMMVVGDFEFSSCRVLGEFDLLVIEWEKRSEKKTYPCWTVCDRHTFDTYERKKQWRTIRTLYIPTNETLTKKIIEKFWKCANEGLLGIQSGTEYKGFTYCSKRFTHIREYPIRHPVEHDLDRTQVTFLCRWGDGQALMSVVSDTAEQSIDQDTAMMVSDINRTLPIGCATIHDKQLMLVFPQIAEVDWDADLVEKVSEKLAHWADRHQWVLMRGEDDGQYFHQLKVAGISNMKICEAMAVLGSLRKWCDDLNCMFIEKAAYPVVWRVSTYDRLIKTGVISSASEMVKISCTGKFQIAYSLPELNGPSDLKKIVFYLSAKPANERVVTGDFDDIWDFLSRNIEYEKWLGDPYQIELSSDSFHYAYAMHSDGKQYRRLRLALPLSMLEKSSDRDLWLSYLVKLATVQLLGDVFQYNAAKAKFEEYLVGGGGN